MTFTAHVDGERVGLEHANRAAEFADVGTVRRFVGASLAGLGRTVTTDLQLAVSELVTNAIEHAGSTQLRVDVAIERDEVVLTVVSHGAADGIPPVEQWTVASPTATAGRGLAIVRAVATSVEVERVGDAVRVVVRRTLRPEPGDRW